MHRVFEQISKAKVYTLCITGSGAVIRFGMVRTGGQQRAEGELRRVRSWKDWKTRVTVKALHNCKSVNIDKHGDDAGRE